MRTVITITQDRTMPGTKFLVSVESRGMRPVARRQAGYDAGEAAATAMECAIKHGGNGYVIFAPDAVIALIPEEMRSKQ